MSWRIRFGRIGVLAVMSVLPAFAGAETIADAWAAALQSHQQLAAANALREAADYDLDRARAERGPSVDVMTAFTQFDAAPRFRFSDAFVSQPLFNADNQLTTRAQLSLPIFTSGSVQHGIAAARSMVDAAHWQLAAVEQNIKLEVAERYLQVLRAESAMTVADSNVATLAAHTKDARQRYEHGGVPQNDYLAASVSLANATQRRLQAHNALEFARAVYNRTVGRPLEGSVALDPLLDLDGLIPVGESLDSLVQRAIAQRGELKAFTARAEAARGKSAEQRAKKGPQVSLTGGYTFLENQVMDKDEFWSVGVAMQWNLFDSGRIRNQAAALQRQAMSLVYEREDLVSLVALSVRQEWLDREEAESRQSVADVAVAQASENLRVAQDRYRAGAGTNTEVLDAEALRALSLSNRDSARFDSALAQLRLARAVGVL